MGWQVEVDLALVDIMDGNVLEVSMIQLMLIVAVLALAIYCFYSGTDLLTLCDATPMIRRRL